MSDRNGPLRTRVLKGLSWSLLQTWGTHLVTFIVFLVTARLLGPDAFGTVVIAYTVLGALTMVMDLGMGDALIRARDVDQRHHDTVFWSLAVASAVLVLVLVLVSPWAAEWLDQPRFQTVMRVTALSLPITALGLVPAFILRRSLQFKPLALRSLFASIAGGVLAIGMALAGYGYWSLVAKGLLEAAVSTALVWRAVSYRPSASFHWDAWKALFDTGRHLTGSRLLDIINQRADALIVSARLGPTQLGLYSAAQRIFHMMMDAMFMAIQRVALPAFSEIAQDPPRIQRALLRVVRVTSFVTFPLFAFTAALAHLIVPVLFGARWADAAPALAALCAGGVLFSVSYYNAPVMTAAGRAAYVFRLSSLNAVLNLAAFLIGVRWGIVGVAIGFAVRGYLVFPLNLSLLRRAIGLQPRRYVASVAANFAAACVAALAVVGVDHLLAPHAGAPLRLLAMLPCAVLCYLLILLACFRTHLATVLTDLESALQSLPRLASAFGTLARRIAP
jgi:O-antigen/teichoic acid export membrane protein